jgi:hypothetical protein
VSQVALFLLPVLGACAHHRTITGQVLDRNGDPMEQVVVSVHPGNVEIVTDAAGLFVIDYLRDDQGERTSLVTKTDYQIEAFKPGYHITRSSLSYRRGRMSVDPITLVKDTIRVSESSGDLDPDQYPDRTQSSGTAYEGE